MFEEYEYYPLVRGPALRIPCTHVVGFVKRKYKLVPKLNLLGKLEYYPGGIFEKIELYLLPRGAVWVGHYKPGVTPAPTACHDESPEEVRARLIGLRFEHERRAISCQNFMIYIVSGREADLYSVYPELRYFVDHCRDRVIPLAL